MLTVKVCGLTTPEALDAAVEGGATLVGFVFFAASPRHLSPERAEALVARVPESVVRVGVFVNPDDGLLDRVLRRVPLDLLQLHGHESAERVAEIRRRTGKPLMKALPVDTAEDLDAAAPYLEEPGRVERLLFDARPPRGAARTGGYGAAFEWRLLAGRHWPVPWLLAGGLRAENLAEAVRQSGARAVDVSSGVETRPGEKDPALIRAFLDVAARL